MVEVTGLILFVVTLFSIFGILVLSLNLEAGYAGQLNLGQVMFYAIGGYASGWFVSNFIALFVPFPNGVFSPDAAGIRAGIGATSPLLDISVFILGVALGIGVAALIGYILAIPTSRTEQAYLAIIFLAAAEITRVLGETYQPLVNGVSGILGIPGPFNWVPDFFLRQVLYAALSLSLLAAVYLGVERLTNSPFGRLLRSIREDELASQGIGKNTYRVKRHVMAIGSGIAGLAGALSAFYLGTVQPQTFTLSITGLIFTMMLLGGIGNNLGVLVGALVLTGTDVGFSVMEGSQLARFVPFPMGFLHQILVGLMLILLFAFRAQGIFPEKPVKTPASRVLKNEPT